MSQKPLISVQDIKKYFDVGSGMLKAVDGKIGRASCRERV